MTKPRTSRAQWDDRSGGQGVDDMSDDGPFPMPSTAQAAMLLRPKTLLGTATLGDVRMMLADDHVHAVLLVDGRRLLGAIGRSDLPDNITDTASALPFAKLTGRIADPGDDLETLRRILLAQRGRRLAVVDQSGDLLGLLCLNRRGDGFCSDADVLERRQAQSQHLAHLSAAPIDTRRS